MATREAHNRANAKYAAAHYDKVTITLPKGERERWKARATEKGLGLAEYLRALVARDMDT